MESLKEVYKDKFEKYKDFSKDELLMLLIITENSLELVNNHFITDGISNLRAPVITTFDGIPCLNDHMKPGEVSHIACNCPKCSPQY